MSIIPNQYTVCNARYTGAAPTPAMMLRIEVAAIGYIRENFKSVVDVATYMPGDELVPYVTHSKQD